MNKVLPKTLSRYLAVQAAYNLIISSDKDEIIDNFNSKSTSIFIDFDKKIKNHNVSNFYKKDILKKYFFSLCPHNDIYPGYYEEKIPESFLSGCIPISWADDNISNDFNPKAFINLNNGFFNDFDNFILKIKDDDYLKKFLNEPLINYKLDLSKERDFVSKIYKAIS